MTAARLRLLVVDDEAQIRRGLRLSVETERAQVPEAETGQLDLHAAAVNPPDGVVLDLGLPDRNGAKVMRQLREWAKVPVLVLSVRSGEIEIDPAARVVQRAGEAVRLTAFVGALPRVAFRDDVDPPEKR